MVCSIISSLMRYIYPLLTSLGGVLGFFGSHSYAHASDTAAVDLPRKLKGSDMVLFAVLKSLGLLVEVLPVLEDNGAYFPPDPGLDTKGEVQKNPKNFTLSRRSTTII